MAESRDRNESQYQNEPLMPDAPNPQPDGDVMGQAASLGGDGEAPLLNVSRYPDATGDLVETAYPGQDSAIDATPQQSRTGGVWPEGHVSPGMQDRVDSGDGLRPVFDDIEAARDAGAGAPNARNE